MAVVCKITCSTVITCKCDLKARLCPSRACGIFQEATSGCLSISVMASLWQSPRPHPIILLYSGLAPTEMKPVSIVWRSCSGRALRLTLAEQMQLRLGWELTTTYVYVPSSLVFVSTYGFVTHQAQIHRGSNICTSLQNSSTLVCGSCFWRWQLITNDRFFLCRCAFREQTWTWSWTARRNVCRMGRFF